MLILRVTGIPLTEGQIEEVHDHMLKPSKELDQHILENTLVTLCNGKGLPPFLGTEEAGFFWMRMMEYASRNLQQATALLKEKGEHK